MRARRRSIREIFTFTTNSNPDEYRIVKKDGETTIKLINQPGSKKCFYPNVFLSVVELSSKWISLIFLTCFLLSWFTFALLYYFVSEANGDLTDEQVAPSSDIPCVTGITDFQSIFLFSMETQTTIGYGSRYVTEECPTSIVLVIVQSIIGCLLLSFLTGVVLFKFQEPKKRAHTVLFSKVACVYEENNNYYVEIQILNMQRSQLIDPIVTSICVMNREDGSGKFRFDMQFEPYQNNSRLFFRPRVYRHLVDQDSPFWDFNRNDFEKGVYEMIVMLNGVDEFTDTFVQVRTSYTPSEVMWSRYFKAMSVSKIGDVFKLNFNDFTQTNRNFDMSDDSASVASSRKLSDISATSSQVMGTIDNTDVDGGTCSYTVLEINET